MPLGDPSKDIVNLNVDSLWSGGPFQDPVGVSGTEENGDSLRKSYTGGNPNTSVTEYLPGIRDWIFTNGSGSKTM